jgi:hypothetical protein
MKEIKPMGDVNLPVLCFDPSQLIDHLVAPFVHALVSDVHLRIENPQEAEALL